MKIKLKKAQLIALLTAVTLALILIVVSVFFPGLLKFYSDSEFVLFDGRNISSVYIDNDDEGKTDYKQVIRAAEDLKKDIRAVTGKETELVSDQNMLTSQSVIVGTLEHSDLIDSLADSGKIDVSGISGQWEAFTIQMVENPVEGVKKALVIAGSDKRGTIYGIYELSQAIGVSPWYWWADVPIRQKKEVVLKKSEIEKTEMPDVKYRGIFINDEENFTVWSEKFKNDSDSPGAPNPGTYARVFELMLRLKANVLWPAMHQQSTAFNAYVNPETGISYNAEMADRYGIIMGASHCEMLLRNNETEWEPWCEKNAAKYKIKKVNGNWKDGYDFTVNPEAMKAYWEERVAANYRFENVYTIGLRGVHDAAINCKNLANPTMERKAEVVKQAVEAQIEILRKYEQKYMEETGEEVVFPKIFCPYKEASEYFKYDLSLPEETIIVWADDNHGYVRAVSTREQLEKYGGAGVYYHVSYYDSDRPQSYLWVTSTPLVMIYDEMSKAYNAGSDDFWILNVGDIKPSEIPMEFFLTMAWDTDRYTDENIREFTDMMAARDFGLDMKDSAEVSDLIAQCYQISIAKRPEYHGANLGSEYSLINYGDEAQIRINQMEDLCRRSDAIYSKLTDEYKDAYYQKVHYMLRAGRYAMERSIYQQKNQLYYKQGRFASVNAYAKLALDAHNQIMADLDYYNKKLAGGKWDGIINPYCTIQFLPTIPGAPEVVWVKKADAQNGIGSVCEGQSRGNEDIVLKFNSISNDRRFIDVFNKGLEKCSYKISADSMVILAKSDGTVLAGTNTGDKLAFAGSVEVEERLWVSIDWSKVDTGKTTAHITVTDDYGFSKTYNIEITKSQVDPEAEKNNGITGHYETNGVVSVEAEHYSRNVSAGDQQWRVVRGRGRTGDAMKCFPDLAPDSVRINSDFESTSPYLEYNIYFQTTGVYKGVFYRIPTLNEGDGKTCRIGISFNGSPVEILRGYSYVAAGSAWTQGVRNQIEKMNIPMTIEVPSEGWYTIRIYKSDAGMEFDKFVLFNNSVGEIKSHLGAPESYNTNSEYKDPAISVPPEFNLDSVPFNTVVEQYLYDFTSDARKAASGYTGIDHKTQKSDEKGYEWDESTFDNVKGYNRTHVIKANVRDQGFVYGNEPASIKFMMKEKGQYIVGVATGDRQHGGFAVKNMSIEANGHRVLENINIEAGKTIEKYFIVDVGDDKILNIAFSGDCWIVSALEMSIYNPARSDDGKGIFKADENGWINIEAEAVLEQSDIAWSEKSSDGSNIEWIQTRGISGTAMFAGPNSDTSYMQPTPEFYKGAKMNYKVSFPENGSYYIWVYAKTLGADDDSIFATINDALPVTLNDMGDNSGEFKWFNVGKINVDSAGNHIFSIWVREDGVVVDKFIITQNPEMPAGLGGSVIRGSTAKKQPASIIAVVVTVVVAAAALGFLTLILLKKRESKN